MNRTSKVLLGILSILPLVLLVAYFISFFFFFTSMIAEAGQHAPGDNNFPLHMLGNFGMLFLIIGLMALLNLGLLVYYIIHAVNNKTIESAERIIWVLIFVFAGMIGFPIYWYMRIWKTA